MDLRVITEVFHPSFRDLIDIVLVWILVYNFLLLIRGTRAVQILQGVGVLLLLSLGAYYFHLATLYWVLRAILISIAVALPIVFLPELRRALGFLGRSGVIVHPAARINKEAATRVVDEVVWAATVLSQMSTGALIVIERDTGLDEFIETGIQINAEVSSKLLLSLFLPRSPLHDGAVIVHDDKVVAASCYLPLSQNVPTGEKLGTRHRAALGLSEETDAFVVAVSEETGGISVALDGTLHRNLNEESLKRMLSTSILPEVKSRPPKGGSGSGGENGHRPDAAPLRKMKMPVVKDALSVLKRKSQP
ncbi:MAG: diadenylate cyclase CdaA [Candidatus Xenobia bacterium]